MDGGKAMSVGKNAIHKEVLQINASIKKLEEKKINMLREIPFTKWTDLTNALQRISTNMVLIIDIQNEMSALNKIYESKEDIKIRKQELNSALNEIRERLRPLVEIKNSILAEYGAEFGNEIQNIYLQIEALEKKKKNFSIINDLVNNPENFT